MFGHDELGIIGKNAEELRDVEALEKTILFSRQNRDCRGANLYIPSGSPGEMNP